MRSADQRLHGLHIGPAKVEEWKGQALPHRGRDVAIELVHEDGHFGLWMCFGSTHWRMDKFWGEDNAYEAFKAVTGVDLTLPGRGVVA